MPRAVIRLLSEDDRGFGPLQGTVRAECLDWTLVMGRRHLERVLRDFAEHFNAHRPHRGLGLRSPERPVIPLRSAAAADVKRTPVVGGLINEYYAA